MGSARDPRYFDELYLGSDDPWGLNDRFYEQRKRDLLLAALPRPRFERAFEPGCAGGALTVQLACRCESVIATDVAARAVELARLRSRDLVGVQVTLAHFPLERPAGTFDLIVISEVGYYCADLDALVQAIGDLLRPDGVLLGCHWRRRADDHPQTAEAVHAALGIGRNRLAHHEEADFLLDVWTPAARSVAQSEGIVG